MCKTSYSNAIRMTQQIFLSGAEISHCATFLHILLTIFLHKFIIAVCLSGATLFNVHEDSLHLRIQKIRAICPKWQCVKFKNPHTLFNAPFP